MLTEKRDWTTPVIALALAFSAAQFVPSAMAEKAKNDSQIQTQLQKTLHDAKFKDIQATVQDGTVSLAGSVDLYGVKADAERKVRKIKAVTAVNDNIRVDGPSVSDQVLARKLVNRIQSDRIGYGTTAFNAFSLNVHDGIVTLGGTAYGPVDKDFALSDASYTPGVKGVVDSIQVDPLSPFDDRIRLQTARAVYGYPSLNKYAMDPVKPIRIVVQNGNVTLVGAVLNQADRDVAGLRANGVAGVFKVTNNLQIASRQIERD